MTALPPTFLLEASHDLSAFDCGSQPLNEYLRRHALANHLGRSARTFVALNGSRVIGYYTLAAGAVRPEDAPARVMKGQARHPVSVILLARLAIDLREQKRGLGSWLLGDAFKRTAQAADLIGCRAMLVHAKDEPAKVFYQRFGFISSPTNDLHLLLLLKDLLAALPG